MKGQNFRLFANGGQRIVGALSCNFDYDIQTEDDSSKDTEGDWTHVDTVSKQMTITTEAALQLYANQKEGTTTFGSTSITVGDLEVWPDGDYAGSGSYNLHKFSLHMGDIVSLSGVRNNIALFDEDGDVLNEFLEDGTFEADADYSGCYLAALEEGAANVIYNVIDGGILFKSYKEGQEVYFAFHATEGDKNADLADASLISGNCVITKRTLRSTNRQRTVWSLTAVSNGEIYT